MSITMDDIITHNKRKGEKWFSDRNMHDFHTRLCDSTITLVLGGALFVTSEKPSHSLRRYTIRFYDSNTGHVETFESEECLAYATLAKAYRALKSYAQVLNP